MAQYIIANPTQAQRVADVIRALNPKRSWRIEIGQHHARRTLSQNKRYWVAIMELANETGHSKDEMHEAMKRKFLPPTIIELGDEEIPVTASSAKLGKQIFSEYMERVIAFAATEFGIVA